VKQGWQKWYMRGENPFGADGNPTHASKLSLTAPVERKTARPHALAKRTEETGSE
jgi:hypothetical protein